MIEMKPPSRDVGYTIFKKRFIKFIRNVSIAFEILWGIIGWTCLIIFACYVYVVGRLVESITLSGER
jgi:hypothetical protein